MQGQEQVPQMQPQVIYVPVFVPQQQTQYGQPAPAFYPVTQQAPFYPTTEEAVPQIIAAPPAPQFSAPVLEEVHFKEAIPSFDEEFQNVDFSRPEPHDVCVSSWLKRGWRLYCQDWLAYSLLQAIIMLGMFVGYLGQDYFILVHSNWSWFFTASQLFLWPMQFGFFIAGSHIVRQPDGSRGLDTSHFFKAFFVYAPLLLLLFVVEFVVSIGFILFIIPGIYLGVTLCFSPLVYIEFHHDTNPMLSLGVFGAISHSHSISHRYFWKILGFILICGFINFLASIFFFVGLVVTIPVCMLATVFAFRDLFYLHPDKTADTHCYMC